MGSQGAGHSSPWGLTQCTSATCLRYQAAVILPAVNSLEKKKKDKVICIRLGTVCEKPSIETCLRKKQH